MGLAQSEEEAGREGRRWALERQRGPCVWQTLAGSGPGMASVNAGRSVRWWPGACVSWDLACRRSDLKKAASMAGNGREQGSPARIWFVAA